MTVYEILIHENNSTQTLIYRNQCNTNMIHIYKLIYYIIILKFYAKLNAFLKSHRCNIMIHIYKLIFMKYFYL